MCHYTIEACWNDHEVSRRRKCTHCSSWEEGIDSESCKYEAALIAGEVERKFLKSRICEQCVREIIKDMKAQEEELCKEEAVENKEETSGHKRALVNENMETISKTDEDEAPRRNAESSHQLRGERLTCDGSASVGKSTKELAEAEDSATKSKLLLGDVRPSGLQGLERKTGPGILSNALQNIANNQANQTNKKRVANTTKKQSLGGKSSGARDTKHVSDYKIKGIPEPVIR